ncbi:MAG: hypothetical protein R3B69_00855 [Candidatus Paceibacterota bacterium]
MDKKWNLQDIRPATPRRSQRPDRRADKVESASDDSQTVVTHDANEGALRVQIKNGKKHSRLGLLGAFGLFFVIILGGFILSLLSAGAEVTVEPRHREPNVNAAFTAYRTPQVDELSYETMVLEAEGERQVSATGQEEVEEQAEGVITIYKTTPGTERLIKNTRFESPDGLVFRVKESVVVPGAVESNGEVSPGSINAEVFADNVGEQYNLVANTRFTVPGFKEGGYTELYNAIYAENTDAFTGGFSGVKFVIDENELETAKQALQTELRDSLLGRVDAEKPAGFVVFESAITFTYESLPAVEYGENLATIKERALLQIPIFKAEDFAAYIAASTVPGYEGESMRIDNVSELEFTYTSATTTSTDIGNVDSVEFKLVGKPQLVWTYDEERLKTDLLGAPKTALTSVLGGYPALEKARAVIRPFWKRAFPQELDKIEIIEEIHR